LRSRTSPAPQYQTSTQTPTKPKRRLFRPDSDTSIDFNFEPVSLVLTSLEPSLADLAKLSREEKRVGRRLVAFDRKVVGDDVQLSFRRISPEEYSERLFVISCIFHEVVVDEKTKATHDTWYTSVDILRLISFVVDGRASFDEKGRIRRNLQFINPTTITRAKLPQFFQLLMEFPMPKPRGIEKDIKVFPWNSLEAGLNKVMEKYVRSSPPSLLLYASGLTLTFLLCPN